MAIIYVPYNLDEYLPDFTAPLPAGVDVGEVILELPGEDLWSRLALLYNTVGDTVERTVRAGELPVVVSSDCTVTIGMAAGLQRAGVDPAIVWFDGHGDLQTLETTPSGYVGGMALQFLVGYRPDLVAERLGLRPPAEDRVVLVDARDLDPPEADYLATAGVTRVPVEGLDAQTLPDGPLLVNLDLDIVDPERLPGLRYPAAGGPDVPAVLRAVRTVFETGRVAGINIACTWNPHPDPEGIRQRIMSQVLPA